MPRGFRASARVAPTSDADAAIFSAAADAAAEPVRNAAATLASSTGLLASSAAGGGGGGDDGGGSAGAGLGAVLRPPPAVLEGGDAQAVRIVKLWRNDRLTDAVVRVAGGVTFRAHRVVLAAASPVLDTLMDDGDGEDEEEEEAEAEEGDAGGDAGGAGGAGGSGSSGLGAPPSTKGMDRRSGPQLIELAEVPAAAFEPILNYLYEGKCTVDPPRLLEAVRSAAELLNVFSLAEYAAACSRGSNPRRPRPARMGVRLRPLICLSSAAHTRCAPNPPKPPQPPKATPPPPNQPSHHPNQKGSLRFASSPQSRDQRHPSARLPPRPSRRLVCAGPGAPPLRKGLGERGAGARAARRGAAGGVVAAAGARP